MFSGCCPHWLVAAAAVCVLSLSISSSHKVRVILPPTVIPPVHLGVRHPSGAHDQIFITVRQLPVCACGMPSLMIGLVCSLQLIAAGCCQHSHS
jgi:hypothetical protein